MPANQPAKPRTMAYSAYSRALNDLIKGNEIQARKELEKMKTAWAKSGITIDVDASLVKMKAEIKRMMPEGVVESTPSANISKSVLADNPYVDNFYTSMSNSRSTPDDDLAQRTARSKSAPPRTTSNNQHTQFDFDKQSKLAASAISLANFTDDEIYAGATKLPVSDIQSGSIVISYNNVAYGGYAPNLAIKFNNEFNSIRNAKKRVDRLERYLLSEGIAIPDLQSRTPIALTKGIASQIKDDKGMSLIEKEAKIERITKRITQILLNETNVSNDYILSTREKIRGRNYGNVGVTGGLLNSLFSNVVVHDNTQMHGTISTATLIKAGTADCRATNATYAALLNVGYREIGTPKEAKILYTKMSHGTDSSSFENSNPEDHNIVLVKEHSGKVTVLDAYFEHVNNTPLRSAINGVVSEGSLKKDENEVGKMRSWAFQIPGAPPYPSQQQIKASAPVATAKGPQDKSQKENHDPNKRRAPVEFQKSVSKQKLKESESRLNQKSNPEHNDEGPTPRKPKNYGGNSP